MVYIDDFFYRLDDKTNNPVAVEKVATTRPIIARRGTPKNHLFNAKHLLTIRTISNSIPIIRKKLIPSEILIPLPVVSALTPNTIRSCRQKKLGKYRKNTLDICTCVQYKTNM
jgi:hypothetical protein